LSGFALRLEVGDSCSLRFASCTPLSLNSVRLRKSVPVESEFEIPCNNRVLRGKQKYPSRRSKFKLARMAELGGKRRDREDDEDNAVGSKKSGIGLVLHEKGSGPVDLAVKVGPQVHCGGGERERERERRR